MNNCTFGKTMKNLRKRINRDREYRQKNDEQGVMRHKMRRIQSKLHRIRTYDVFKISLSCFDDKRYILDDGVNSLVYFYEGVKSQ